MNVLDDLIKLARARKKNPLDGSYTNKLLDDKSLSSKAFRRSGRTYRGNRN